MPTKRAKRSKKNSPNTTSGLQDLVEGAEELLESLKDQQGAAVEALREKLAQTIDNAQSRISQLDVPEIASDAVESTAAFLRNDPWRTVAIGALAVLAISLWVRSNSGD